MLYEVITGDARGLVLMVFPEESALQLLQKVVCRTPSSKVSYNFV